MLKKTTVCSILIILFYTVGLIGFLTPSLNLLFLKLVPFHLLLMFALLIISHSDKRRGFWLCIGTLYLTGFIVEVVGINSGWIFGSYYYGKTLGIKLFDTPLLIGVNWVILIYTSGIFLMQCPVKNNLVRSISGALILVLFDILIEPVAIKFNYWNWTEINIPVQNYIAWFFVSLIMFQFFFAMNFKKQNSSAIVLFFAQAAFFMALNLWAL